jgi:hypothetical protein
MEKNILKSLVLRYFQSLRLISITAPPIPGNVTWPGGYGSQVLYLAGYDEFIAPHSLIPIYNNNNKSIGLNGYNISLDQIQISHDRPTTIDQAYYYLTPFVHDNFIVQHKVTGSGSHGTPHSHVYTGYNGLKPVVTVKTDQQRNNVFIVNENEVYGNKFLLIPPLYDKPYIEFSLIPNEDTDDIYTVPDIGDVILKQPADNQPWYGKRIKIFFEPGFISPKINSQLSESTTDIPLSSFLRVGEAMTKEEE